MRPFLKHCLMFAQMMTGGLIGGASVMTLVIFPSVIVRAIAGLIFLLAMLALIHQGATIVETVIVIAIGYVLVALMMPPVTPHGGRHARRPVATPSLPKTTPSNP